MSGVRMTRTLMVQVVGVGGGPWLDDCCGVYGDVAGELG
jgi:hypothetical protein